MDFDSLEKNIVDMVIEEQAKLGYMEEQIRFYYPLGSLNNILGTCFDEDRMQSALDGFCSGFTKTRGPLNVSHKNERFCFLVSKEAVKNIHDTTPPDEFVRELVKLVSRHDIGMEVIYELFASRGRHFEYRFESGEFDVMMRFTEGPDLYYYCFKEEGGHITYHRFTEADYNELNE